MDGQCAAVEQICGPMYEFQPVQETEAFLFRLQVDGEHGARRGAELLLGQFVEGIVGQSDVVHRLDESHLSQFLCQPEGVGGLPLIAHVERLQSECLLIGHLRRHVGPQVHQQFVFHPLVEHRESAVVDNQAAQRCAAARDVFRARYHLDVNAQFLQRGLGEGYHGRVGYHGHALSVGYFGNGFQVGHFLLWVCYDFQEHAAGLLVDGCLHGLQVGKVSQPGFHAKPQQRVADQCQRVAEQMARRNDGAALCTDGQQRIADSGHTRVERRHMGSSRQRLHALLEVGYRGILHACIVGRVDAVAEGIGHLLGVAELECHIIINGHCQRAVGIGPDVGRMDCYRLFFQHFLLH